MPGDRRLNPGLSGIGKGRIPLDSGRKYVILSPYHAEGKLMKSYRVILTRPLDDTEAGWQAFYSAFGQSYRLTPGQVRELFNRSQGVIYTFDNRDAAEQAVKFLESIGAQAEIVEQEVQPAPFPGPAAPGPAVYPPAGAGPSSPAQALPQEDRILAMVCHLGAFGGYVFPLGNIIVPLVIWLIKKEESPFVDFHGKESLNFQISILIYTLVCVLLMLVLVGILLIIALLVFEVVVVIMASIAASNGQYYHYPLCIRLVK